MSGFLYWPILFSKTRFYLAFKPLTVCSIFFYITFSITKMQDRIIILEKVALKTWFSIHTQKRYLWMNMFRVFLKLWVYFEIPSFNNYLWPVATLLSTLKIHLKIQNNHSWEVWKNIEKFIFLFLWEPDTMGKNR